MSTPTIDQVQQALEAATGSDPQLDTMISEPFGDTNKRNNTSSVDDCIALIDHMAPDWGWLVGRRDISLCFGAPRSQIDEGFGANGATCAIAGADQRRKRTGCSTRSIPASSRPSKPRRASRQVQAWLTSIRTLARAPTARFTAATCVTSS